MNIRNYRKSSWSFKIVSNKFKKYPAWFANEDVVNEYFIKSTPKGMSMLNRVYNSDFINNNKSLKKHHQKYPEDDYAPAWKAIEFFTFGVLLKYISVRTYISY